MMGFDINRQLSRRSPPNMTKGIEPPPTLYLA
nr:MAG TPA: hypothetical protein [Caudoviricetes sp.]